MIKKWKLKNFKSVCQETTLEMAPLTIFAGANNSGKSTLIQSILLTVQTIQSPVHSKSVVLNGHISKFGNFKDIVSKLKENEPIFIGFQIIPPLGPPRQFISRNVDYSIPFFYQDTEQLNSIECNYSFLPTGTDEKLLLQPQLEFCQVIAKATNENKENQEEEVYIKKRNNPDEIAQKYALLKIEAKSINETLFDYDVVKPNLAVNAHSRYNLTRKERELDGASLIHFLPRNFFFIYEAIEEEANYIIEQLLSLEGPRGLGREIAMNDATKNFIIDTIKKGIKQLESLPLDTNENYLKQIVSLERNFTLFRAARILRVFPIQTRDFVAQEIKKRAGEIKNIIKGDRSPLYKISTAPLQYPAANSIDYILYFFSRLVKYLGPLRDEPKPIYPLSGSVGPNDVGFKGEHTAAVLDANHNTLIDYLPSKRIVDEDFSSDPKKVKLIDAVLDWLDYMGVVNNVETVDKGKLGLELKVSTSEKGSMHDLTHVGVGVSQVLPILVLSLLSDKDSTLIFEQPELHLHPRVQTRLADFFVSMTMIGKQCIVETHSEYLINRLRFLSAISANSKVSNNTIIYFVEKNEENSTYRQIRINKFGVIENWPDGFFDENEVISAALLKKMMERKKEENKK